MNLVDKIILGLLVVILPVGVFFSYRVISNEGEETSSDYVGIDEAKLEDLVNKLSTQKTPVVAEPKAKPISISSVVYSTESGKLKVAGSVPEANAAVLVTATVLPHGEDDEEDTVKGLIVETVPVLPTDKKAFMYEYEVDEDELTGMIELRIEQNDSVRTVRFDLEKREQIF